MFFLCKIKRYVSINLCLMRDVSYVLGNEKLNWLEFFLGEW